MSTACKQAYYLNLMDRFDNISNHAYTLNLDYLNKMIGSLSVHPTSINALPGMPGTCGDMAELGPRGLVAFAGLMIDAGALLYLRRSR